MGLTGGGVGQFGKGAGSQYVSPTGIAVDSVGDAYVMDLGNFRVQKFNADGEFLLMFGGDVNETTGGNVCTAASGDNCVAGQLGTDPGAFSIENLLGTFSAYVAVAPDDTVFVGDRNRIQKFDSKGDYEGEVPLPEPGNPGALAVDPTNGNLYFAFNQYDVGPPPTQPGIYRLNPETGAQVGPVVPVQVPIAIEPTRRATCSRWKTRRAAPKSTPPGSSNSTRGVLADSNGAADVYQWEAEGKGDCTDPGGCVGLISSGKSPEDSASGANVFFTTAASLLVQDPGLIDIYNARAAKRVSANAKRCRARM